MDILRKNEEAREQINQALKLNPHSSVMYALSGLYYYFKTDYEKSIEEAQKALEISDDFASMLRIFKCYVKLGKDREAIKQLMQIISIDPSNTNPDLLDKIYQKSGIEGIISWFIEWIQLNESTGYYHITSFNYRIASVYALMGDSQNAIEYLEKSMKMEQGGFEPPSFDFNIRMF